MRTNKLLAAAFVALTAAVSAVTTAPAASATTCVTESPMVKYCRTTDARGNTLDLRFHTNHTIVQGHNWGHRPTHLDISSDGGRTFNGPHAATGSGITESRDALNYWWRACSMNEPGSYSCTSFHRRTD